MASGLVMKPHARRRAAATPFWDRVLLGQAVLGLALLASACSSTGGVNADAHALDEDAASAVEAPSPTPQAARTATPRPDPSPTPQPTPLPTARSSPTTTAVDDTPVVVAGDDWAVTERKVAELTAFIEDMHDLEFLGEVAVLTSEDIGADIGNGFEPFPQTEWSLLQLLGIVDDDRDRSAVNQLRRDRVRGVCCGFDNGAWTVTVEPQPTRLETEMIIVHELTHALHAQHDRFAGRRGGSTDEYPSPAAAATEGVPQLVAMAWLETAGPDERARALDELAIITPDLAAVTGAGAKRILEFAYGAAPAAFEEEFASRGAKALQDLIENPPTTTEQVLFPSKWRVGEEAIGVRRPDLSDNTDPQASGTLGAALLSYALSDAIGEQTALEVVSSWTGGTWTLYDLPGTDTETRTCLAARIAMDTAQAAGELAESLVQALESPDGEGEIETSIESTRLENVTVVRLDVC